jgi:hypothetical protein
MDVEASEGRPNQPGTGTQVWGLPGFRRSRGKGSGLRGSLHSGGQVSNLTGGGRGYVCPSPPPGRVRAAHA